MLDHPDLMWWKKCPCCGYCEFDLKHIHPSNHELALKNMMAYRDPIRNLNESLKSLRPS